jgi:hypothetical protein
MSEVLPKQRRRAIEEVRKPKMVDATIVITNSRDHAAALAASRSGEGGTKIEAASKLDSASFFTNRRSASLSAPSCFLRKSIFHLSLFPEFLLDSNHGRQNPHRFEQAPKTS